MKTLIYKDFKLVVKPICYTLFLFVLIFFVPPNFPYAFIYFYPMTFLNAILTTMAEGNDFMFSSLLPISKKQYIASKFLVLIIIEVAFLLLCIPFGFISNLVIYPESNNTDTITNIVSLTGIGVICFTLFDATLLPIYFRNAPKWSLAFIIALATGLIGGVGIFGIVPALIPTLEKAIDSFQYSWIYLLIGIAIAPAILYPSYLLSVNILKKRDI